MDRHDPDARSDDGTRCGGDGARDIVQLGIDERRCAGFLEPSPNRFTVTEQRLQTNFEDDAERLQAVDEGDRVGQTLDVEGDD